jgi:O-antigen/teichoic acid export membrane protein
VIRALVSIALLQFLSMLLVLARAKILAVTVGVAGVGTMANVDALAAVIAQTLSLSMPFAALRFLPASLRQSPAEADLLYRRMRFVLLALLLPATLVCIVVALRAPQLFGSALVPYRRTVILGLAGLPVVGMIAFLTNAYAGAVGHMASMRLTVAHAGVLVLSAIAAAAGLGVDGFYAVYAAAGALLVIVATTRLRVPGLQTSERIPLRLGDCVRLPAAMWRFAAWLLPLTFLAPYAAWFVKYSTLRLYGVEAAGILQGAIGLSLSVRALLGAAHAVFLTPNVNRQGDAATRMDWANEFQRTTGLLFAIALPPLLLFSDVALRMLYAPAFLAGSPFVPLFVAAEVLTLLSGTYQSLLIAGDWMSFHVAQNLAAQALLAATAAIALPRVGLAGAGFAALAAPLFLFGSTILFLYRQHRVRPSASAIRACVLTVALLVASGVIGSRYTGLSLVVLGSKAVVCVLFWLVALALVPSQDRRRLLEGVRRVMRRRVTTIRTDEVA